MELFKSETPGIREYLRNNYTPLNTEKQAIRDSIEMARTRLDALQTQDLLLDSEAQSLSSYIAEYSSLLAPIRRLPVDLLRTIFLDPDIHKKKQQISYKSILTQYKPNRLGAVCHHWRCVTLETATMWAAFEVFLNQPSRYSIDALRIALQRSQNALLSVSFQPVISLLTIECSASDIEMLHEVLQHTERWAMVELPLNEGVLPHLSSAQGRLDHLHTLTVHNASKFDSVETLVFARAPRLRTLRIKGFPHRMLPAMPWSQLTRLCIDSGNDNPSLYHHLFSQAQNIRHLSIRLERLNSETLPQLPILSPHLEKMIHHGPVPRAGMDVLARVIAPALRQLQMINIYHWDTPIMQAFIKRSGFSLHTLVLHHIPVRVNDVLSILRMLPTLENLFLEDLIPNAITNATMEALTVSTDILLPALSTFVLSGAYLFGESQLLAMLESRITAVNQIAPLTVVDFSLPHLILSAASLQRLNTIRVSVTSFRFSCIDQGQRAIVMEFGDRMGWIHELQLEVLQVKKIDSDIFPLTLTKRIMPH
ncbi:hypothetical protein R3P38DRAFT_2603082 [Favolaschia claudopus]|uniref:F-box domain-containing protein n=1 Tax=Favolaschia claudopus TaxID=2862362 RepID=A0AAW0DL21_9AGAR